MVNVTQWTALARTRTTLSLEMGTGTMMEGLALEREDVQPLVICSTLPVLTGSSPNSLADTHIEPLHALGLVPAKSFLCLESLERGRFETGFLPGTHSADSID